MLYYIIPSAVFIIAYIVSSGVFIALKKIYKEDDSDPY
jgi:hypothetical protein